MRKIVAAINTTLDGFCDHTLITPDEEIHQHYAGLLNQAGLILYGRITYQLMQFWQELVKNPSGEKSMDDFALAMDRVPKIVFSHTLKDPAWESASLATRPIENTIKDLRQQPGGDILVGSRSLIVQLLNHCLLDELQLCVHPLVAGSGSPLFEGISESRPFNLVRTKTFGSGAVLLTYHLNTD